MPSINHAPQQDRSPPNKMFQTSQYQQNNGRRLGPRQVTESQSGALSAGNVRKHQARTEHQNLAKWYNGNEELLVFLQSENILQSRQRMNIIKITRIRNVQILE